MGFDDDTARVLLQNKFERIENLVKINQEFTMGVPTVLAAIWGIEGGLNHGNNVPVLCIITITLLLIWRYFAHYIDDNIAKIYIDIVKAENQLGVPPNLSLFDNLVNSLIKNKNNSSLNQGVKLLCDNQKVTFLECLYEKKKMGYRGHEKWDILAFCLIFICIMVMVLNPHDLRQIVFFFFTMPIILLTASFFGAGLIIKILFLALPFYLIYLFFPLLLTIGIWGFFYIFAYNEFQTDPTKDDIEQALKTLGFDPPL